MDLFADPISPNLLPRDGECRYVESLLGGSEADGFYQRLQDEIDWQRDRVKLYGRYIVTKRAVAWHGDAPYRYTYSHNTKIAAPWTPALAELKARVEAASQATFNCCLLNLYHSGEEGMAWHSDDEKELNPRGAIASLSLGEPRRFLFRHKQDKQKCEVELGHGSLLIMRPPTQEHWQHSLPPMRRVKGQRINLTFRAYAA